MAPLLHLSLPCSVQKVREGSQLQGGRIGFWGPPGMEGLSVVREIKREEKSFGGGEWEGKGESLEQKKCSGNTLA